TRYSSRTPHIGHRGVPAPFGRKAPDRGGQRQAQREGGALTDAVTISGDRAAVHRDDVLDDGETQPHTFSISFVGSISLKKSVKYMGKQGRLDPQPLSLT